MEKQRWEESEKKREERLEKRKSQKKEDAGARKGSKDAVHFVFPMICGSGGSKSRLAKAAGGEPAEEMRDEKLHAVMNCFAVSTWGFLMSVAISNLIGFILKCDSGKLPRRMLLGGAPTQLMPRRCRMCLRGRDGSDLAHGFSARIVTVGKNGTHAAMRTAALLIAHSASDRSGHDTCQCVCLFWLYDDALEHLYFIASPASCLSCLRARWCLLAQRQPKILVRCCLEKNTLRRHREVDTLEGCARFVHVFVVCCVNTVGAAEVSI